MVSIIIPSYRPSEYLYDCLKSLKYQTYSSQHFDIHIVLNGEKQPYYNEILEYTDTLSLRNVKIHHIDQKGVSNARNVGLALSHSRYVVFVDDDDCISERYMEGLVERIDEREDCIAVSNTGTFTDNSIGTDYISKAYEKCKNKRYSIFAYRGFMSSVWGKIIPRKIIGPDTFDRRLDINEDAMFMFQISKRIEIIELAPENCIYMRRIREGSASRNNKKIYQHLKACINSIYQFTRIYMSAPLRYNLFFYMSRIMASLKVFILKII